MEPRKVDEDEDKVDSAPGSRARASLLAKEARH